MEVEKVIARNRINIARAIADYRRYTSSTEVLDDVSDAFIDRLARDNAYSKMALRELFSKSPVWNEDLDALVINGTRTHDPDPNRIRSLAEQILRMPLMQSPYEKSEAIAKAIEFFVNPDDPDTSKLPYLESIAPKAYAPGKKLSRVFRAMCKALGVADENSGSEFQRLYAQFADELTTHQIGFKLFVSVNPAHFLTMSNPKQDRRGSTLTSCHSFNVTDYEYNNGCSGYARDENTFIVFTVADPTDAETLNNRKTTRQIFAYRPGNGLLLQSRMYNTSGGVYGAAEDSKLYRDLVQREISELEGAANLWRTYHSYDSEHIRLVEQGEGFGGYPDWTYNNFDGHISIRLDHAEDYEPIEVGTYGLCIVCGSELTNGLYCEDCDGRSTCEECGERCSDDDLYEVYNADGERIWVCEDCRDRYYTCCDRCGDWYPNEEVSEIGGESICNDCRDRYYEQCDECGEYFDRDDLVRAINAAGYEVYVCEDCASDYYGTCDHCGQVVHVDTLELVYDENGNQTYTQVCEECANNYFVRCEECECLHRPEDLVDGYCAGCRPDDEDEEKEDLSA